MSNMISERAIMELVQKYAVSPAGRKKIREKTGWVYSEHPERDLIAYGEKMKIVLLKHIVPLIHSITADDIIVQPPQMINGVWGIKLAFRKGSLRRKSLIYDELSRGINNIVLLFAKGYHASMQVEGMWNVGSAENPNYIHVKSRQDRPANSFLLDAVKEFNATEGGGIATALLLGEYKKASETN